MDDIRTIIASRLKRETGVCVQQGRRQVALVYPCPYPVGMASLGFQTVYRCLNAMTDTRAERAFLPDRFQTVARPLVTYESQRPVADFPIVAFSVGYELDLPGVFSCLELAGINPWASERKEGDPWIVMGGPLTYSNPLPLAPFADVIIVGEAEDCLEPLLATLSNSGDRNQSLAMLASIPGMFIPAIHGENIPARIEANDEHLPAYSAIVTPEAALADMFLIEAERGCSRSCSFCLMRRGQSKGMRVVPKQQVVSRIPSFARRVGLVGAAVTDHPELEDILRMIVDSGREIGISSLRADRLTSALLELLVRGGCRTPTIGLDGASERLRTAVEKRIDAQTVRHAAQLVREAGLERIKIYVMIGLPGETEADIDELIAFLLELSEILGPRIGMSLGVSPFVPKLGTPLAQAPFVGIRAAETVIRYLREGLGARVRLKPTSARWAWVEYVLAQGGTAVGRGVHDAWRSGNDFAAFRRALTGFDPSVDMRTVHRTLP